MKSFYKILTVLIVLIVISLVYTSINRYNEYDYSEQYEAIPPIPEKIKSTIKLYFIQDNNLSEEFRTIVTSDLEYEKSIVKELIEGPRNTLMKRPIPSDTKIISIETVDKICYVNLSKEYINNQIWQEIDSSLIIWSLVNSLTELDYIQKVQILIEGEKVILSNKRYSFEEPFITNEVLIKKQKITPFTIVTEFLENIKRGRYDVAYEALSIESVQNVSFIGFKEKMEAHVKELAFYDMYLYNTKKFSDYTIVSINYKIKEEDVLYHNEIINEWKLIIENGEWKILIDTVNY